MIEPSDVTIARGAVLLSSLPRELAESILRQATTGAQRVAEFLLESCDQASGACTITLPCDKTLTAGGLGMQPQSLSRAFNRLDEQGVKIAHNMASIADIEKLRYYMLEDRSAPWRKAA